MRSNLFGYRIKTIWIIAPLCCVMAAGFGTLWFLDNFEKKEYIYKKGASPQARSNPLLAAGLYLERVGHRIENIEGLKVLVDLPPVTDSIILHRLPEGMSPQMASSLMKWIDQGGHLLFLPNRFESEHPGKLSLMEQIGVEFLDESSDCDCPSEDTEPEGKERESDEGNGSKSYKTGADGEPQESEIQNNSAEYSSIIRVMIDDNLLIDLETDEPALLHDKGNTATYSIDGSYHKIYGEENNQIRNDHQHVISRDGSWLLQYSLGKGTVTVLSEIDIFHNNRISSHDHAFFLSWLTRADTAIWIVYSTKVESFLLTLWKKAPMLWLSFLVMVILVVWRFQLHGGAKRRLIVTENHSVIQHIDATGQYYWRTGKLSTILKKNRDSMLTHILRRKIGLNAESYTIRENLSSFSQKIGCDENELKIALYDPVKKVQDVLEISRAMQQISKHSATEE